MSYNTWNFVISGSSDQAVWATQNLQFELGKTGDAADTTGQKFVQMGFLTSRSFRMMIFSAQMGVFYISLLISAQDRALTSALTLEDAQESYNRAIRDYGVGSEQAVSAARRLERAQIMIGRANTLATLSYVGMGLQIVSFSAQLLRSIGPMSLYIAKIWAMVTAQAALKPWLVPAMIGAAGVMAGVAAGFSFSTQINMQGASERDLNRALEEHDRRARYEFRRASGQ